MTYFGFLLIFLGIPLAIILTLHLILNQRGNPGLPNTFRLQIEPIDSTLTTIT